MTVLVVDDSPGIRMIHSRLLEGLGHIVVGVASGEDAVAAFKTPADKPIDAALIDLEMPGMDGLGTVAALRSIPGGDAIPLTIVSAHSEEEQIAASLAAGATAHLKKPLTREILAAHFA
jgi:CheY-like chemotaxis protein